MSCIENIKKIHSTHISDFNNTKWDLATEMETLNALLEEPKVNENKALQQMKLVTDMENQLKMTRLEMLIKVKNELSEAQQKKLKSVRTENDLKPTSLITTINDGQKIKFQVGKSSDPDKEPLYVILDNNGEKTVNKVYMSSLDPDNIESVNVLKGKSAKTAYGKKGKNGVIVIRLKQ